MEKTKENSMKVMYANTVCQIISEKDGEVKLIKDGENIKRIEIGGYCGTERKRVELNTFIANKSNVTEIIKEEQ